MDSSNPSKASTSSPRQSPTSAPISGRRRHTVTDSTPHSKRVRPYPLPQERPSRTTAMSSTHSWSVASPRTQHSRPTSIQRDEASYQMYSGMPEAYSPMPSMRPSASSTLSNAMGGSQSSMAQHSRTSRSPENMYQWDSSMQMNTQAPFPTQPVAYPGVAGLNNVFHDQQIMFDQRNPSPESNGSSSSHLNLAYASGQRSHSSMGYGMPASSDPRSAEAEVHALRKRVRELEAECKSLRKSATSGASSPPESSGFKASWKARTDARKRIFCSLNRAGNALCAWHDSRRERRAYPPRNAPAGYLNCGCTHDEALFEESLARHGVGSYHPGENVRMDPALRNPLLKLMQSRYGYKDGDFERDPITGDWLEGEGHTHWEQQAHSGSRPKRTDH